MTSPPPPKKRKRERGQRKQWKMTNWVCYFFLMKRLIWYAFMLFLHFSRVGHALLGKAELSECQKRFSFGILLGCLHYHIIANTVTTKFEGIFWWSPCKSNMFPFDPPLFFVPPSTPQIPLAGTQSTFLTFFIMICTRFSEFDSNLARSGFPARIVPYF